MRDRIDALRQRLVEAGVTASIRGEGAGSFLFAEMGARAIEASLHAEGGWWIEFWDADVDEAAPSVGEVTLAGDGEALEACLKWLTEAVGNSVTSRRCGL